MKKNNFFLIVFLILSIVSFLGASPAIASAVIDYPSVEIRALDKSTARTTTLKAKVGETIQFGSLYIKVQSCRKSDPLDKPESAAFLQIWEIPLNSDKSEWVFSGWMFASSPALSAMDHAVYDIWVLDCTGQPAIEERESVETPITPPDAQNTPQAIPAP